MNGTDEDDNNSNDDSDNSDKNNNNNINGDCDNITMIKMETHNINNNMIQQQAICV